MLKDVQDANSVFHMKERMLKVNRNKKLDDFLLVIKEGVNFTIALERVPKRIEGSDKAVQLLPSAGIQ